MHKTRCVGRRRLFQINPRELVRILGIQRSCGKYRNFAWPGHASTCVVVIGNGHISLRSLEKVVHHAPRRGKPLFVGGKNAANARRIKVEVNDTYPFPDSGALDGERREHRAAA
jgi:hypothetical protein